MLPYPLTNREFIGVLQDDLLYEVRTCSGMAGSAAQDCSSAVERPALNCAAPGFVSAPCMKGAWTLPLAGARKLSTCPVHTPCSTPHCCRHSQCMRHFTLLLCCACRVLSQQPKRWSASTASSGLLGWRNAAIPSSVAFSGGVSVVGSARQAAREGTGCSCTASSSAQAVTLQQQLMFWSGGTEAWRVVQSLLRSRL